MNRRKFLKGLAGTAAAITVGPSLGSALRAEETPAKKPVNLLFVLADQWRFSAFSAGGPAQAMDEVVSTPTFDRLAGEGARFTRCYATNPVCTPNRSCILTSRFSHQHGMIFNNIMLPPGNRCLAEPFAEAGYNTHYIGKWHMDGAPKPGFVPPGWRRRGFATFEGFNRGHLYHNSQTFSDGGELLHPKQYEPTYQADRAIEFMKRSKGENKPFFCYLSWGPPHTPYRPPKDFDIYDPAKLKSRPNVPGNLRESPQVRRNLAGYYGLCTSLDHELGRVLGALSELSLAEDTLVVFTADHGDMHASHGLYFKGKPQEESVHVPLLMRLPGRIRSGQNVQTLTSSIDLMPTMLSICGLKAPSTCVGKDLSGAAIGEKAPEVDSVYSQGAMRAGLKAAGKGAPKEPDPNRAAKKAEKRGGKKRGVAADGGDAAGEGAGEAADRSEWRAVVTPTHKLTLRVPDGKVESLYDLEHDPYEQKNLVDERQHAALLGHMMDLAKQWAKETGDPFPNPATPAKALYSDEEARHARG